MRALLFSLFLFQLLSVCSQTTYHVETTGSNSNPCTSGSPCATVQYVISNYALGPGDSILIGSGTWTDEPFTITSADDGDATGYVVIQGVDSASTIFDYFLGATNQVHISGGNYIKIRNIKFDDASDDMIQISGGSNNIIENCWIKDGSDQVSIETNGGGCNSADNNIVRNNYMESSSYTYVDINGSNACGSDVNNDGNEIYNNIMVLMGGGSANPGIELSFATNTKIYNNHMLGGTVGIEIANTGGADGTDIYNNYIQVSDDGFQNRGGSSTSSSGKIRHNSFYTSKTCVYFYSISGNNIDSWDIRDNIFYTTSSSTTEYCFRNDGSSNPNYMDYNLYYSPNGARTARRNGSSYSALTGTGSTDWDEVDHSDEVSMLGDENSIEADPSFVNPGTTNLDALDLTGGSAAEGAGTSIAGIGTDIYGTTRAASPAIGAFDKGDTPLPVEMVYQTLTTLEFHNRIDWVCATQFNNDYFEIQRSADGYQFETIGTVDGEVSSNETRLYSLNDNLPLSGISYYRILQVDVDGTTAIYPLMVSNRPNESRNEIAIFSILDQPNHFMIKGAIQQVNLYNLAGQQLSSSLFSVDNQQNNIELDHFATGTYILQIVDQNDQITAHKILLQ